MNEKQHHKTVFQGGLTTKTLNKTLADELRKVTKYLLSVVPGESAVDVDGESSGEINCGNA